MIHPSLTIARRAMRVSYPFFSTIADNMKYRKTKKIPTIAIDDAHLYYNTEFLDSLTDDEIVFVLAHVLLLGVFNSLKRCGDRDKIVWNAACCYAVNAILVDEKVGTMPAVSLYDEDFKGMSSNQIFDILKEDSRHLTPR